MDKKNLRPDHSGSHRRVFEKNKAKLLKLQPNPCPLCGKMIDYSIKYPDPMSATIDHVIPISRGGHPSAINNLEVVHRVCNIEKSNKLVREDRPAQKAPITNRDLPLSMDWAHYRAEDQEDD